MIAIPRTTRPAIVVDDRLPLIEYVPVRLAEIVALCGESVTDEQYRPLPGERRQGGDRRK